MKIYIMHNKEDLATVMSIEMPWDPDEAKAVGTLKGIAEYKTDLDRPKMNIEFSDPKPKKKINTTAKVVNLKKNKNSLF